MFHRVARRTDHQRFLYINFGIAQFLLVVKIGIAIGEHPVEPAFQFGRAVAPPDRVDKYQGIGPLDFVLFNFHVFGHRGLGIQPDFPIILYFIHLRLKTCLIKIVNLKDMSGIFQPFDKSLEDIPAERLSGRVSVNDIHLHRQIQITIKILDFNVDFLVQVFLSVSNEMSRKDRQ